jgi:MFS transporter, DHA2 family, multidrug resistance protein
MVADLIPRFPLCNIPEHHQCRFAVHGGGLGSSNDESTWVLTSYLVSNAIVLPISGWLARLFGRKRFFIVCIFIFTVASVLCGSAPSLNMLLLFRVIQGAGGGGLQPMAQAILADTFPPQKRGLAFALYGITAIMAPTIGPTLGGWITDNYSWRWIFFINLPVGILATFLVMQLVEDPPFLRRMKRAGVSVDFIGISVLALGVERFRWCWIRDRKMIGSARGLSPAL